MTLIALMGVLQGLMIALFMFLKKGNLLANRSAALSTLFSALQMLLVVYFDKLNGVHFLLNLKFYTWVNALLIPPFFFFYVKFLTHESPRLIKRDFLHFLPFLVAFIAICPLCFLSLADKIAFTDNTNPQFAFISKLAELSHAISICVYGIAGFWVVRQFQKRILNEFSNLDKKQMTWLSSLSIAFSLIGLTGIIGIVYGLYMNVYQKQVLSLNLESAHYTLVVIALVFYFIAYNIMTQPEVFGHEYKKAQLEAEMQFGEGYNKEQLETDIQTTPTKYTNSQLNPDQIDALTRQLLVYIEKEKPHLQPNLSADELAMGIHISKHQLSQLLNGHLKKNFYDFINEYRIEAAKEKLIDPRNKHLTILGIAYDSGFKSKSTFYTVFKNYTGISPTEYQEQNTYPVLSKE